MIRLFTVITFLAFGMAPAMAHIGHGATDSFTSGFGHPLAGIDHVMAMVLVGMWAAIKGGRALWAGPVVFVGVMLFGSVLGMQGIPLPFVDPAIFASVITLGLLVALAVDLPLGLTAAMVAVFALFHGYAHGTEVSETARGIAYMAGFALATAALHVLGIGFAVGMTRLGLRSVVRFAGAVCVFVGAGMFAGLM